MRNFQWFVFVLLALIHGTASPSAQASNQTASRAAIIATAEQFANVRWTAEARHFFHGEDESGVRVDTPDIELDKAGFEVGEGNVGMPYSWGGFTSLDAFETELAADRWAGHVPQRGNARSSAKTIGVDCSGLVSRCWNLPRKQSTRSLGALCYELEDYDDLLPGDIVNRFDAHVALFTGWVDETRAEMKVIEAARLRVEESTYAVKLLRANNFLPMRYKPLDDRWMSMPKVGEFEMPEHDSYLVDPALSLERFRGTSRFLDGQTKVGEWVTYEANVGQAEEARASVTWMAAASDKESVEVQRRLQFGQAQLDTGATFLLSESWVDQLSAFGHFSQVLQDLELESSEVTAGSYMFAGKQLSARRVVASITGKMMSRSTHYPIKLDMEVVLSEEVPLLGICSAELRLEIDYGIHDGESVIGVDRRSYRLGAFGRKP